MILSKLQETPHPNHFQSATRRDRVLKIAYWWAAPCVGRSREFSGAGLIDGTLATAAKFCVVSATLTAAICCYAQVFGRLAGLVDEPDGIRKLHNNTTPLVGGLAVLIPSLCVSLIYLMTVHRAPFLVVGISAAVLMLAVGVADDRHDLPALWRVAAFIAITFAALAVEPLFVLHKLQLGAIGTGLTVQLGILALPITGLMIIGFLNSANMADGMNGQLLGSTVIWCALIARHLGVELGTPFIAVMASAAAAMMFNLQGRLFSGSSGAYAGSLLVGLGAIAAYRISDGTMSAALPALWFWLPVTDCVRLLVTRTLEGKSPFAPDRNHFHHMLLERMRPGLALLTYLALLALPGLAAEVSLELGAASLAVCGLIYATFVLSRTYGRARTSEGVRRQGIALSPVAVSQRSQRSLSSESR